MRGAPLIAVVVVAIMLVPPFASGWAKSAEWSAPRNLGPVVNSGAADIGAAISKDGLSLYFGSTRAGGFGALDMYVSRRAKADEPWGLPVNLGPMINTPSGDHTPSFSRDGHWMFFISNRPGGFGDADCWASYRPRVHDDFGWQTPMNVGAGVNGASFDGCTSYFEPGDGSPPLLFGGSNRGGNFDVYVSALQPDGRWGPSTPVTEVNSPASDRRPSVRFDGLEMFFFSNRGGGFGDADVWVSRRRSVSDPWGAPVNLGPTVNGPYTDSNPYIAPDRETLLFVSTRPGGSGLWDIYVTTRGRASVGK